MLNKDIIQTILMSNGGPDDKN